MLKLVFGRSGYGKTEYVFSSIKDAVLGGSENILLITPEQYSFIAERRLLRDLGPSKMSCVENGSFSRISSQEKKELGGDNLPVLSKGGKAVLMMQSIEKVKDDLQIFNKKLDSLNFVNSMIRIYDEMKSCNLDSKQILNLSKNIENEILFRKMTDISMIMSTYESLIEDRFLDASNELTRLYNQIKDKNYFKDKIVFIDGFNGFVAQEYKILELIISECKEVVITLCCDDFDNDESIFSYVNNSAKIIEKIALKANIKVEKIIKDKNFRCANDELAIVEKCVLSDKIESSTNSNGNVEIYRAKNITDECEFTSRKVRYLLRKGYKAGEIAVIVRNIDDYRDELSYSFKKYDIPFFHDERQPIKSQPLVIFIEYLFRCVIYSLRSDDIISLAKTGLTSATDQEINELENYIYMWNISGSKWSKPFENSTKGFTDNISDNDKKALERINATREKIINPILKFKSAVKGANPKKICTEIYYTLIGIGADKKIQEYAKYLSDINCQSLAQMQGRIWDLVMEILDQMVSTLSDCPIKLKDFSKIFSLIISNEDLGALPTGIDNVQFGQADRIRTDNPRAVFVLGANEGDFPQSLTGGGLISESERRILLDNDFKLYSYGDILNKQEKYFAYMACTCAKEMLYISYQGNTGKEVAPSQIVTSIKSAIGDINDYSISDISNIDLIETNENSFELMSQNFLNDDVFYSSLKKYFENDSRYKAISDIALNKPVHIDITDNATKLFKYNMYVSASKIEDYFNCSFKYFCKYGLNARPAVKAEIDPMQKGTLIHYVLEMILSNYGSKKLSNMSRGEIISIVNDYVESYFVEQMGNVLDLSTRFKYNYKRISRLIYDVVIRLSNEFKNSEFEAKAFELDIDRDGSVKPEIISLKDGGTIQIRGSIDRVDTYEKNGKQYVRVVDYKSGTKSFDLSDIMYGLNLQMFIYLFSLCEDKTAKLTGIPAGVLYMHSSRDVLSFDSKALVTGETEQKENDLFKMKGIVVCDDEDIPYAMESDLQGKYIPVKMSKKGLIGSLTSLEEIGYIHRRINDLIADMGYNLHNGYIERNPVRNKNHKNTCEFCDYKDVCASQRTIENITVPDLTRDEISQLLKKEYGENA